MAEHRVVVDPHDPDRYEADRIRDVGGPEVEKHVAEVALCGRLVDADGEDQERDCDREDSVAECLRAPGLHAQNLAGGPVDSGWKTGLVPITMNPWRLRPSRTRSRS